MGLYVGEAGHSATNRGGQVRCMLSLMIAAYGARSIVRGGQAPARPPLAPPLPFSFFLESASWLGLCGGGDVS